MVSTMKAFMPWEENMPLFLKKWTNKQKTLFLCFSSFLDVCLVCLVGTRPGSIYKVDCELFLDKDSLIPITELFEIKHWSQNTVKT